MNKRTLRLEKYGISGKRYKELCGFCEQYPEWKKKAKDRVFVRSPKLDGMPKAPNGGFSNPTEELAFMATEAEKNCEFIEGVARLVSPELWEFIIKSVCYEVPINYLITVEDLPLSKSAFYELRRYFFFVLDSEKRKHCGKKGH